VYALDIRGGGGGGGGVGRCRVVAGASADALAGHPQVRKLLSHLPMESLGAGVSPYSFVVGLGVNGEVVQNLRDTNAGFQMITSANECDGSLYLGSVTQHSLARYPL
jgi:hypothetical protein